MTEAEWRACSEPHRLLAFLREGGKLSDRKGRLLAVAVARRTLPLLNVLNEMRGREAIEVAERFADGLENDASLQRAAAGAYGEANYDEALRAAAEAVSTHYRPYGPAYALSFAAKAVAEHRASGREHFTSEFHRAIRAEYLCQCGLVREIFGNPFRPMCVDPPWLTWNRGTVPKLAEVIYDERRFADLPVLADALEEAGCTDADILDHCRQPGEHVRGCWVVDLVLGKE